MKTLCLSSLWGVVLAIALAGCSRSTPAAAPVEKPVVVAVEPVVYSAEAIPVYATGLLSRKSEANLSFKVGGIIEEIAVREGDQVKAGQVLARLRLTEIDAHVTQAKAALDKARRDLERVAKLQADHVATLENLQDAQTAVDAAEAGLKIAEFNREHSLIAAPTDGHILRRTGEPEEIAEAGHTVLAFASEGAGWIARVGLAEVDANRVKVGDSAEVRISGADTAAAAGRITQISESADTATRTTSVEIQLDAPLAGARSGYVVRAVLKPAAVDARPVVPASALIEGVGQKGSLFLVPASAAAAHRVEVEIAGIDDSKVYLKTDLPKDARVVVRGAEYLREGSAVEVAKN